MANPKGNIDNLQPGNVNHTFTPEEVLEGNKKSIETRRRKASLRQALKDILNSDIKLTKGTIYDTYKTMGIDISKFTPEELASIGLLFGAINGNATNFKTMLETNNEITETENTITPTLNINIVDNSKLEGVMYEENKH